MSLDSCWELVLTLETKKCVAALDKSISAARKNLPYCRIESLPVSPTPGRSDNLTSGFRFRWWRGRRGMIRLDGLQPDSSLLLEPSKDDT
jgi:hypothetical protein